MPPVVFRGSPLPDLINEAHSQWVFTHRGVFDIPATARITETVSEDYERLALLGEMALALVVMDNLYEACPLSRASDLTSKKTSIINNEKLAEWATEYRLHERIQAARAQEALIRSNTDVRASVFKAYVGAYWKQLIFIADRVDEAGGRLPGPYPNPVTIIRAWLDPLIEYEIRRAQDEDDELVESMRRASLNTSGSSPSTPRAGGRGAQPMPRSPPPKGGALALLNQKASQQKPPRDLTWHESDEGDAHAKIFKAELAVDGRIIAVGVEKSKKAARQVAASLAIETLGWN